MVNSNLRCRLRPSEERTSLTVGTSSMTHTFDTCLRLFALCICCARTAQTSRLELECWTVSDRPSTHLMGVWTGTPSSRRCCAQSTTMVMLVMMVTTVMRIRRKHQQTTHRRKRRRSGMMRPTPPSTVREITKRRIHGYFSVSSLVVFADPPTSAYPRDNTFTVLSVTGWHTLKLRF